MDITDLLLLTQQRHASDLHLTAGLPPMLRINGDMVDNSLPPLTGPEILEMLYSIMSDQQRAEYERDLDIDFAVSFADNMRFRVNAFHTVHGPAAVFRTISIAVRSLEALGAPPILQRLAELKNGLILVTGPTGSGKTTTLAAVVDYINQAFAKHILTIEDPVEFVHTAKKCVINQREVGRTTRSFARALKSALREDPDVILVGEMRDLETIQLALSAAETGHLVLGTLHTNSAPDSIDRIIDVFPAESKEMVRTMLANALQGVVTQMLVKKMGGGRVAAYEIMVGTPAVRNLVREGKIPQLYSMMQMGTRYGMITMKDSIQQLVQEGKVDATIGREAILSLSKDGSALEVVPGAAAPAAAATPPSAGTAPGAAGAYGSGSQF